MKLLLDQGVPRSAAQLLRRSGIDAVHVADEGLSAAPDLAILAHAASDGRTVVTLDADFHALLMVNRATAPSVIRIRREGLRAAEMAGLLEGVLMVAASELEAGALVTVTASATRIHRLR